MDRTELAAALAPHRRRVAGSYAERRAALGLRDLLEAGGRVVDVEPFRFHQRWALAQAIAAALAVIGSVLSVTSAAVGTALVAVAAASSILEATGGVALLRRLTGTRASQNVSCPPRDGGAALGDPPGEVPAGHVPPGPATAGARPGLLVVAAAYDVPRASAFARVAERVSEPWLVVGAALMAVLACCVARLLGADGDALTAVQLLPTLVLLAAVPLLVDVELSPVGDGAAEAAGVEAAIALADRLDGELERLDVWLVLCGAGGALGAGMRAWRRRHRHELSARPAVTIEVGAPEPGEVNRTVDLHAEIARGLDAETRSARA